LNALREGDQVYPRLAALFREADDRYNSGLFHFQEERGRDEPPDTLTLVLTVDDRVIKDIIKRLYYPDSPYEFSALPAHLLGQVYEQFLGKVIRLTPSHQAKVEEKPEVKKAGGVYYTPAFIVEYIVKSTVGEWVKDKTPRDVSDLKVLDPACGSGSFLLGAYQYLLDWHRDWYIQRLVPLLAEGKTGVSPEVKALLPEPSHKKQIDLPIFKAMPNGGQSRVRSDWKLTTAEKKRILVNNIFGVDIDSQAVEVTKLSLLLKVLEGENEQTLSKQLTLFQERALPSLHQNIKCGNSLIGTDFFRDVPISLLTLEDRKKVNPFDWKTEFSPIMERGGFDIVIGNPPYVRIQTMKDRAPEELGYYKKEYLAASKGNYDIYTVFVEKGLRLLNQTGLLGLILPHKFFTAAYGEPLRTLISQGKHIRKIVHFGHQQIFSGAITYTCLLFLSKLESRSFILVKVDDVNLWKSSGKALTGELPNTVVTASDWNFVIGSGQRLFERLKGFEFILKNIAHIFVGTQTSAEEVFVLENCTTDGNTISGYSKADKNEVIIEKAITKPFLKGKHIRRYLPPKTNHALICPYIIGDNEYRLLTDVELKTQYPLAYAYLSRHKKFLISREKGRFEGREWWAFGYPKSMTLFHKPKIICPFYHNMAAYSYDIQGHFFKTGYGIVLNDTDMSYLYILGLLNSRLLFWYYQRICTVMRAGYSHYMTQYIEQLPIHNVNFSDLVDKERHDKIVELADEMLKLYVMLEAARIEQEKILIKREIEDTDKRIDSLVYELYGLNDEEIKIVESAVEK
jgi:hypothetical protein